MESEIDQVIDSYYEDSVEMKDNKFLIFKRVCDYRNTNRRAAIAYLEDRTLGTTVELGTYFDASWRFVTPITENLFWSTVKEYQEETKDVFKRIRSHIPGSKEIMAYQIQFSKLRVATGETLTKLRSIFKGEVQDNND
jgi:hypothetical protein